MGAILPAGSFAHMEENPTMQETVTTVLRTLALGSLAAVCSAAPQKDLPVFKDGEAQVVEAFKDPGSWIRDNVFVETEFDSDNDGKLDRMHVDITRQEQTETQGLRVPVIYETSPYYSGTGSTKPQFMWNPRQEVGDMPPYRDPAPLIRHQPPRPMITQSHVRDWLPRGFAVIHSASVGTGRSQGCPGVGAPREALAPKAVIDWLNGRAKAYTTVDGDEEVEAYWATGKVGMTGTSYNGTLPCAAATTGVDGLEAIIPVAPLTSYYHYYRSNGLIRHPDGYIGEDNDVIYDFIHSGYEDVRDYCITTVKDEELMEGFDRVTGDYNDFWDGRNYRKQLDKWKAATLMAHAFNDWNVMPEHSVEVYAALKEKGVPVQAYFHQGGHGGPPPLSMMNRWFTRYLYGVENDVESDPRSWIVRTGDRRNKPTPYDDYPHPEARPVQLYAHAGGEGTGELGTQRKGKQGTEALVDDVSHPGAALAKAEESPNRLLYATPELKKDVHISGTGRITLRMALDKEAGNLSIWIVSLPWTDGGHINDNIITRSWADPQNSESLSYSEPLEPGEFVELSFELQPDDQVIKAGQRIGLMVFSSDREYTLWPKPGTELTLDLDETVLELPVVGGAEAFAEAVGTGDV